MVKTLSQLCNELDLNQLRWQRQTGRHHNRTGNSGFSDP